VRKFPGVEVTVSADLRVPEPRRFATETIARWLRDNATREGVNYVIVFNPAAEMRAADVNAAAGTQASGSMALPGGREGGREATPRAGNRDEAPGGGRSTAAPGRTTRTPGARQPAQNPGRTTGDGPTSNVTESTSPDAMAPLTSSEDLQGAVQGRVTFRFTAYLKPYEKPAPAEGAAGGANEAGTAGEAGTSGGANSGGGS
jgi:hypothetical protein